jgi:hypothetical protein
MTLPLDRMRFNASNELDCDDALCVALFPAECAGARATVWSGPTGLTVLLPTESHRRIIAYCQQEYVKNTKAVVALETMLRYEEPVVVSMLSAVVVVVVVVAGCCVSSLSRTLVVASCLYQHGFVGTLCMSLCLACCHESSMHTGKSSPTSVWKRTCVRSVRIAAVYTSCYCYDLSRPRRQRRRL